VSQCPEPQSPSLQHNLKHSPTQVRPLLQNPRTELHGMQMSLLLGGGKHAYAPLPPESQISPAWTLQPWFVNGLHFTFPPIVMHEPFDGETSGASHAGPFGVSTGQVALHFDCRHASSAWKPAPMAHVGFAMSRHVTQFASAEHALSSAQQLASMHALHCAPRFSDPLHAVPVPVLAVTVTPFEAEDEDALAEAPPGPLELALVDPAADEPVAWLDEHAARRSAGAKSEGRRKVMAPTCLSDPRRGRNFFPLTFDVLAAWQLPLIKGLEDELGEVGDELWRAAHRSKDVTDSGRRWRLAPSLNRGTSLGLGGREENESCPFGFVPVRRSGRCRL